MSKFQDFVIGMNEAAGLTPAGVVLLSQFGADEKTKALSSIKSQVRGAFQGIRSTFGGKREAPTDDLARTVAHARRASRIRGTSENFMLMQTGLLRSVSQNITSLNNWMASLYKQVASPQTATPATPTKTAPTAARRTPMRDPKTGRFVARELSTWERIAKAFESFKLNNKPVATAAPVPLQRDPKTGRFLPRTASANPVGDSFWTKINKMVHVPLANMQKLLQDIQEKGLLPIQRKGVALKNKGMDMVSALKKVFSPAEWQKSFKSFLTRPVDSLLNRILGRKAQSKEGVETAAPEQTVESKQATGMVGRLSTFMKDIRDTFNDLPGVGAATSLMVMKVAKEQTKELVKIRELLSKSYKLEEAAEARADRAEDAKEEDDFEKRAGQARIMPTFDKMKKPKEGENWLFGLIKGALGGIVEGFLLRFGLRGILGKIPGLTKLGGLLRKIPGFGKVLTMFEGVLNFFEKIPGMGKLVKMFRGGGGAAAEGVGFIGKIGEWFSKIGKMFESIPGLGKLFKMVRGGGGVLAKLGGIGEWLGGLTRIFTKIPGIGNLLKLAKGGLGKLAWPITVIMGVFDFFSGWKDAVKILGKAEDDLTLIDKFGAGLGSVLGGLVGILDGILGIFGIKTDIGGFVKKWTAKLYSVVYGFIFDAVMKPFKMLGEQIAKLFGFRSLQSALDFAKFKLDKGTKFIKEAFTKMATSVGDYISDLKKRAYEGIMKIGTSIKEFFTKTVDWATKGVQDIASSIGEKFTSIGDSVAQYLGFDSMKSAYEALRNKITGVFSGIGTGIAKLLGFENFDALVDKVMALKDMILKPFTYIQEKIGGFIKGLGKVAGYLGYNDQEFTDYEKKLNEERASNERMRKQREQESREAAQRAQQRPNEPVQIPSSSTIEAPPPSIPGSNTSAPSLEKPKYDPTLDISQGGAPLRVSGGAQQTKPSSNTPIPEGQGAEWVRPIMSGVTSDFGMRRHPVTGQEQKMHMGTDYAGKMGDPVKAAGDGVVQLASSLTGYGNVVYLNHKNGYQTRYAHLSAFAPLSIGQEVKAGQVIGAVGNTGIGTGPHLHFEVRKGWSLANAQTKPENPEIFFRSQQQDQQEDHQKPPEAVPVQRPPRDPDVMPHRKNPVVAAVQTGIGRIADTVMSNIPAMNTRPVVPPRDPSLSTPGLGGRAPGQGIDYKPGTVPPEIASMAVKMEKETGIPAAVTIAQWATESGWGKKGIGNNVFGITKARRHTMSQTKSTTEDITYDQFKKFSPKEQATVRSLDGSPITGPWQGKMKVRMDREFADFGSLEDAFRDHARLLSSDQGPYRAAFDRYKTTGDVQGFIRDIAPTYATDRNYSNVIGGIASQNNVLSAIGAARNSLGVEPAPPVTVAQAPTAGRDIMQRTAEIASMARTMNQQPQGGTVNVAPVNVNQSSTSIVADLKARNTENTHKRIMDREYYRT